ncbi:Uncharacterised protein [Mycobacteroides abscessus]|nr:Uncharacterised protein [Mycobacteroides abscessus]
MTSCPTAPPRSMPDSVSCARESGAPSSAPTSGRSGRYMSTVSAGSVASAPRSRTQRADDLGRGTAGSTEEGGMTPIVTIRSRADRAHGRDPALPRRRPARRAPSPAALPVRPPAGPTRAWVACGTLEACADAMPPSGTPRTSRTSSRSPTWPTTRASSRRRGTSRRLTRCGSSSSAPRRTRARCAARCGSRAGASCRRGRRTRRAARG